MGISEDRLLLSAPKCSPEITVSEDVRFAQTLWGFPGEVTSYKRVTVESGDWSTDNARNLCGS